MEQSVSKSTIAASDIEVVMVERLKGYLNVLDSIIEVYRLAEREGEDWLGWSGKVWLIDCRERFRSRLKRIDQTHQTPWEMGFFYLIELLWETINPVSHVSGAELFGRVQKAHRIACTLEKILSAMIALVPTCPADLEEALKRFHGEYGYVPF